jgi:leader peptidase (prepilin peptidase) / N-methyltransferase
LPIEQSVAAGLGALGGAVIGSFLATLVIRWPQGRSIAHGRSACDICHRTVAMIDLMPLLSWLLLRGRCRHCGSAIDGLHPICELMAAVIGGVALYLSPDIFGLALALFGWLLLPLALLDLRHFWLPHSLSIALGITGLLLGGLAMRAIGLDLMFVDRLIGALVGFTSLWSIGAVYRLVRKREGLGGGDPPMFGAIGAWIGWLPLPFLLLFAAVAGLAIALLRALLDRNRPSSRAAIRLPLGTLLALALAIALAFVTMVSGSA